MIPLVGALSERVRDRPAAHALAVEPESSAEPIDPSGHPPDRVGVANQLTAAVA